MEEVVKQLYKEYSQYNEILLEKIVKHNLKCLREEIQSGRNLTILQPHLGKWVFNSKKQQKLNENRIKSASKFIQ